MPTDFKPLPPMGSPERKKMIDDMAKAFGERREGQFGAVEPLAIYDQLSQLNYHDRMTLLHQVFQQQGYPSFVGRYDDPEAMARMLLLKHLGHGADGKPHFAGVNQFFHLMSDAPRDAHYKDLLLIEIYEMQSVDFTDSKNEAIVVSLKQFQTFKTKNFAELKNEGTKNPYELMRNLGIKPGEAPFREKPLPEVDGPKYETLPDINSIARKALMDKLIKAAGPITKDHIGFKNPEEVLKILGQYDYASRLALYREVLRDQGLVELADCSESDLRIQLRHRFLHNDDNKMSFVGMSRFFNLMADAPRDHKHKTMLTAEMDNLFLDIDYKSFVDKDDPAVRKLYQRFFYIGGRPADSLFCDPYNRLGLIGLKPGVPPLLSEAPSVPAPKGSGMLMPRLNFWGNISFPGIHDGWQTPLGYDTALCSLSKNSSRPDMPLMRPVLSSWAL